MISICAETQTERTIQALAKPYRHIENRKKIYGGAGIATGYEPDGQGSISV
jgi:hypothetical protein